MNEPKLFYRYEPVYYGYRDVSLHLYEYEVTTETPCGYWIKPVQYEGHIALLQKKRWIKKGAIKRYACATKKEALESLRAKKKKHIALCEHDISRANAVLAQITIEENELEQS